MARAFDGLRGDARCIREQEQQQLVREQVVEHGCGEARPLQGLPDRVGPEPSRSEEAEKAVLVRREELEDARYELVDDHAAPNRRARFEGRSGGVTLRTAFPG
jgi:hypothetical protein